MPDSPDPEAEWEAVDDKLILVQILTELQQIRMALTALNDGDDDTDTDEMYRCEKCEAVVRADERERHGIQAHNAPPDMIAVMYSPLN